MLLSLKQIKGHGRGHDLGFPTINLDIPEDIVLDDGIYAVWVVIDNTTYKGALHFGPVPTFGEKRKSMEVYLLDVNDHTVPDTRDVVIEIDVVSQVRDVKQFSSASDLAAQIELDVKKIRTLLK